LQNREIRSHVVLRARFQERTPMTSIMPGAEPFGFEGAGSETGVLVVHGFTGSPQGVRPWGEHLAAQGWTVIAPRLPGHGTSIGDLAATSGVDWYGEAEMALVGLAERCSSVFVCGLSMGATIALDLAARQPERVAGIAVVNASLYSDDPRARLAPILGKLPFAVKGIGSDIADPSQKELCYAKVPLRAAAALMRYQEGVKSRLGLVRAPALLFVSGHDHVVPPGNTAFVAEHISSTDSEVVTLDRSYHVATLDYDAPLIFERSAEFIAKRAAG
jgi:carboxylesterase